MRNLSPPADNAPHPRNERGGDAADQSRPLVIGVWADRRVESFDYASDALIGPDPDLAQTLDATMDVRK